MAPRASPYGALLESIRGTAWPAARRLRGARPGTHASRLRGRAPELSEYKLYRQGDDPRDLDWKLLARSDRAFVRLSDDRAILPTWLVVDASASMAWPTTSKAKWRAACGVAIGLTSLAQQAGDPVGAIIAGAGEAALCAPSARRDVVERLAHALDRAPIGAGEELAAVGRRLPGGCREVLITDLLGDEAALLSGALSRRAASGEVIVVHVVSRDEVDPPGDLLLARDPEAPAVIRALDDESRPAYARAFAAWLHDARRRWTHAGARYARVMAEDDLAPAIRGIARRLVEGA